MGVTTTKTNKPFNPRGNDQSPLAYNRAALYSGKALYFDGVSDYVSTSLSLTSDEVSISFFLNWDDVGTQNIGFICEGSANDKMMIHTGASGAGVNGLQIALNVTNYSVPQIISEGWNHYLITSDRTNLNIYKNGVLFDSRTTDAGAVGITALTLGIRPIGSAYALDGKLSNFKVYSTALTAAQVADLYNNPEKIVPTGVDNTALKLWLPMMEGAGTTAYDGSGNGNHGTINGATYVNGVGAPVAQTSVIDWNKSSNFIAYSEEFDQWTANISSVTANDTTAPDGQTTADKWIPDSGTTSANLRFNSADIATGTDYVFFCFAKAAGFDVVELDFQNSKFNDATASFNLTSGTITSTGGDNVTEGIIDKGDGWYLCYIVGNSISSSSNSCIFRQNNSTGDGSKGYYLWGAGFNQSSDIVPYVKTSNIIQGSPVLLPAGLTTGRDITGVNLFENVRKQGALNLDGNSWAEVHDNASLDLTTAVTLEAWVYWDGTTAKGLLGRWKGSGNLKSYLLFANTSTAAQFFISNNGSSNYAISTSTSISTGWNHIVGTADGSKIKIYLNGAFETEASAAVSIYPTNLPIEIGTYGGLGSTGAYPNDIAQPRIYNRALTNEEIQRNYNAGKNIYS